MKLEIVELRNRYYKNYKKSSEYQKGFIKNIELQNVWEEDDNYKINEGLELGRFTSYYQPSYYKLYFNKFFKEDTYNKYWREDNILLSTGALDENQFPLFDSLKYTIEYAMAKNWYGYSSCTGRDSAKRSIALLENTVLQKQKFYTKDNVCVILGVTSGLADVMHFIKKKKIKVNWLH